MRKLLVSVGVAGLLFAGAGTAIATSDNANGNACFGQARSVAAQAGAVGEAASARKGDNSTINHDFMNGGYSSGCEHAGNPGGKP